jgi:hypothetical protein
MIDALGYTKKNSLARGGAREFKRGKEGKKYL